MSHSRDSRKWHQKKRWIVSSLLILPPLGILLVWLSRWPRWVKITSTVLSGLLLLSALVNGPSEIQVRGTSAPIAIETPTSPSASPTPTSPGVSPQASPSPVSSTQFQFPLSSCGDRSTGAEETWYPVFIDGGNLEDVRRQYCADAISTVRKQTGEPTIQVASFTNSVKAQAFAAAVGGEVGQPTTPGAEVEPELPVQVTPIPTPSSSPSPASESPLRSPRTGSCDCPYDRDSAGRRCGKRSAYYRPRGEAPACYVNN